MATFTMSFACNNSAFEDTPAEVSRILHHVAEKVSNGAEDGRVMDLNGQGVGTWELTEDDED